MGNNIKLQDLDLSLKEERDIIEKKLLLQEKEILRTINVNRANKLLQTIKENKGNQKQSKNKKRIDDIRENLKKYKL